VVVAVLLFGLGVLVYVVDRGPAQAQWLPAFGRIVAPAGASVFGTWGLWLPSFVHALAFSLLTAAALPRRALPAYGACAAWAGVNLIFELGQHAAVRGSLARGLHDVLGDTSPARALAGYFLRGTFDGGDIAAALAGALLAAVLLRLFFSDPLEDPHET
jgi:hypothetical protein